MDEKQYIEMLLNERIQMLLEDKKDPLDGASEWEELLEGLEEEKRQLAERCLDQLVSQQSENERHLYLAGVKDGIRLRNWILKNCKE